MLRADNVNRAEYSAEPEDEDRDDERGNVHIFSDVEGRTGDEDQHRIIVPQQLVIVGSSTLTFQYELSNAGKMPIAVIILFYEPPDTAFLEINPAEPRITVYAKMERVRQILMRGTLFVSGQTSADGAIVDPYETPLIDEGDDEGMYDPDEITYITNDPPTRIAYGAPRAIERKDWRRVQQEAETSEPVRDLAVAYSLIATYELEIKDRENPNGE